MFGYLGNVLSIQNYRFDSLNSNVQGSSQINPGDGFPRIFTVAFLLFVALAGGYNPAGKSLTKLLWNYEETSLLGLSD